MNEGFEKLAEAFGTSFVDAGAFHVPLSADFVHFSKEGHAVFAEKLGEYIRKNY